MSVSEFDAPYVITIMARWRAGLAWHENYYNSEENCFCHWLYPESLFSDLETARKVAAEVRYPDEDTFEYDKSTLTIKKVVLQSVENVAEGRKEE